MKLISLMGRLIRRRPAAEPFPIYVKRASGGDKTLDIEAFVHALVAEVVTDIAENHMDDMDTLAECLVDERVERLVQERLVKQLVEDNRTRIRLSPEAARRVARLLAPAVESERLLPQAVAA